MNNTAPQGSEEKIQVELEIDDGVDNISSVFDGIEESSLSTDQKKELLEKFKTEEKNVILHVTKDELNKIREEIKNTQLSGDADTGDEYATAKDRIHALLAEFVSEHTSPPEPEASPDLPPAPIDSEKMKSGIDSQLTEGLNEDMKKMVGLVFEVYDKGLSRLTPTLAEDSVSREAVKQVTFRRNFGGLRMYATMLTDVLKDRSKTAIEYLLDKTRELPGSAGEMIRSALEKITPDEKASAKTPEEINEEQKKIDTALGHAEHMGETSAKDFALLEKFLSQKGVVSTEHITQDPKALTDLMATLSKTADISPEFVAQYLAEHPAPETNPSQDELEKELIAIAGQNNETLKNLEIIMDPKKAVEAGKIPGFLEKLLESLQKMLGGMLMSLGIDAGARMLYKNASDKQVSKIMNSKEQGQFETYEETAGIIRDTLSKTRLGARINAEKISGFGEGYDGGVFDFIENHKKHIPTVPMAELIQVMSTEPKTGTIEETARKMADKYGKEGLPEPKDGKPGVSVSRDVIYSAIISGHIALHNGEEKFSENKDVNSGLLADILNNEIDWTGSAYMIPAIPETAPVNPPEISDFPAGIRDAMIAGIKAPTGDLKTLLNTDTANNTALRDLITKLRDTTNTDAQSLLSKSGISAQEIPDVAHLTIGEAHLIAIGIAGLYQDMSQTDTPKPYVENGTRSQAQLTVLKNKLKEPFPSDDALQQAILDNNSPIIFTEDIIKKIQEKLQVSEGVKALTEIKDIKLSDITPDDQKKTLKDIIETTGGNLTKIKAAIEAIKKDKSLETTLTALGINTQNIDDNLSVANSMLILRAVGSKTKGTDGNIFDEQSVTEARRAVIKSIISKKYPDLATEGMVDKVIQKDKQYGTICYFGISDRGIIERWTDINPGEQKIHELASLTQKDKDTNGAETIKPLISADARWITDTSRPEGKFSKNITLGTRTTYGELTLKEISSLDFNIVQAPNDTNNIPFKNMIEAVKILISQGNVDDRKTLSETVKFIEDTNIFDK